MHDNSLMYLVSCMGLIVTLLCTQANSVFNVVVAPANLEGWQVCPVSPASENCTYICAHSQNCSYSSNYSAQASSLTHKIQVT